MPLKQGDEVYLIRNHRAPFRPRGLPYNKLAKGERRKYRITYVGHWGSHDVQMLTKKGTWSVGTYWLHEKDVIPAEWLDRPLEDYL